MKIFLKEALADIRQIGSVAPSSKFLAAKMTKDIDFNRKLNIIELGAGEGVITRHILSEMSADSTLTSFEINPRLYCEISKIRDNRLQPFMESVLRVSDYISDNSVDYIMSGIPLANMQISDKMDLMKACNRVLKPSGRYVQFQYSLNDFKLIRRCFVEVELSFVIWNFPPSFVYYGKAKKPKNVNHFLNNPLTAANINR